ncbi:MAG: hypothetical protein O7B30_04035 [Thaumarchaeota archaeon]|nr:hypothetical protein [Nitrososphaerota archaeon]
MPEDEEQELNVMDHILVSKHEILDEEKNLLVNSCGNPTLRTCLVCV